MAHGGADPIDVEESDSEESDAGEGGGAGGGAGAGGKRARATIHHFDTVVGWSMELRKWVFGLHDGATPSQRAYARQRVERASELICRGCGSVISTTKTGSRSSQSRTQRRVRTSRLMSSWTRTPRSPCSGCRWRR
jgi:hypothetical protein